MTLTGKQVSLAMAPPWNPDQAVIFDRAITPDYVGQIPRFNDDVWHLGCIVFAPGIPEHAKILDFTSPEGPKNATADAERLALKEYAIQRLNIALPVVRSGKLQTKAAVPTLYKELSILRRLQIFMTEHALAAFADLSQDHLDAFCRELKFESPHSVAQERSDGVNPSGSQKDEEALNTAQVKRTEISPSSHQHNLRTLDHLRAADPFLSGGGLKFDPWPGQSLTEVTGAVWAQENLTERIPEEVMGPLLAWSLAYVQHFSRDILAATRASKAPAPTPPANSEEADERLRLWADSLRDEGGKIPVTKTSRWGVSFSIASIIRSTGLDRDMIRHRMDQIADFATRLGVTEDNYGVSASTPPGAPGPWRGQIDSWALRWEQRHLVTACYIIVCFLSGMRPGEVQALKGGCVAVDREDGVPVRIWVKGIILKNAARPEGDEHEWVVLEPVVEAIGVMEELNKILVGPPEGQLLFVMSTSTQAGRSLANNMI